MYTVIAYLKLRAVDDPPDLHNKDGKGSMGIKGNSTYKISPWESYMSVDHGPSHSMTCHLRFWFEGTLDRSRFTEALHQLSLVHPLLSAQITDQAWHTIPFDKIRQIDWQENDAPIDWSQLNEDDTQVRFIHRTGKLSSLGLQRDVGEHSDGTLLVIKFQHAVSDGLGGLCLLQEIHRVMHECEVKPPSINDFEYRHHFGLSLTNRLKRLPWDVIRTAQFMLRSASEYGNAIDPAQIRRAEDRFCFVRLARTMQWPDNFDAMRSGFQISVNDLMLTALFRVLSKEVIPNHLVRVAVPISLRPSSNRSFCNLVSMVFLDRNIAQCTDTHLLFNVSREMRFIKQKNLAHTILWYLSVSKLMPRRLFRWFVNRSSGKITAVFSNFGKPFSGPNAFWIDDARLIAMDSITPIRPGTNLAFSMNRFHDVMGITLRYDGASLSHDNALQLLNDLFDEFNQTMEQLMVMAENNNFTP